MFRWVDSPYSPGRLVYEPWEQWAFPTLHRAQDSFGREVSVGTSYSRDRYHSNVVPLYKLRWPGETSEAMRISAAYLRSDGHTTPDDNTNSANSHYTLRELVNGGHFTHAPADCIVYHLWVNRDRYYPEPQNVIHRQGDARAVRGPEWGLMGMSREACSLVMDGQFALDGHSQSAIEHSAWLCTSYRNNPIYRNFDTSVREHLLNVSQAGHNNFFYLLHEYLWYPDRVSGRCWDRAQAWFYLSRYMHMMYRTGGGVLPRIAGIYDARGREDSYTHRLVVPIGEWHREGRLLARNRPTPVEGPSIGGPDPDEGMVAAIDDLVEAIDNTTDATNTVATPPENDDEVMTLRRAIRPPTPASPNSDGAEAVEGGDKDDGGGDEAINMLWAAPPDMLDLF